MRQLLERLLQGFKGLSTAKKAAFILVLVASLAGIIALSILSNRIDFRVLYSNLSDEDAAAIVAKLKTAL